MVKGRRLLTVIFLGLMLAACRPLAEVAQPEAVQTPTGTAVGSAPLETATTALTLQPPTASAEPLPTHTSPPPTATASPEPNETPAGDAEPTAVVLPPAPPASGDDDLKIIILYDNTSYDPRLAADWGFAALIEYRGHRILFDTGGSPRILLDNMRILEIEPAEIEAVVFSHIHGDHTDGLPGLFGLGIPLTLYVPPSFPSNWTSWARLYADLVLAKPGQEISDGIYTTGEMDAGDLVEQALVIDTGDGIVIVTGCSHPGIVEIVARARDLYGGPVRLVAGGFHLMDKSRDELREIIADLRALEVEQISPTHCTGEEAIALFAAVFGDDYVEGGAGQILVVKSAAAEENVAAKGQGFLLDGVGFATPESVLYDPQNDVYLVSNINGSPSAVDGNGYISRVSPDGEVVDLKWIQGGSEGVVLNAPKGMALDEDVLYIADIDTVRSFDSGTGAPLRAITIDGASFLNDLATAVDGTLYVSDSGGSAVYRIVADGSVERFAEGKQLGSPNGIQVRGDALLVADYGAGRIYELGADGSPAAERAVPGAGLDGLVLLEDGTLLVSSWDASAVYLISPAGEVAEVMSGIPAPADIGFDPKRGYVLIPYFRDNRVEARPLP